MVLVVLAGAIGCATAAHGSVESVSVTSTPPGATIYVNGQPIQDPTPARITVGRRHATTLRLEREGFEPQEVKLRRRTSRWIWMDLGVCLNPLAIQGLDKLSLWPMVVVSCMGTIAGIDLLSGAAVAVQKHVDVTLKAVSR